VPYSLPQINILYRTLSEKSRIIIIFDLEEEEEGERMGSGGTGKF
jgi:hypothetical protein